MNSRTLAKPFSVMIPTEMLGCLLWISVKVRGMAHEENLTFLSTFVSNETLHQNT